MRALRLTWLCTSAILCLGCNASDEPGQSASTSPSAAPAADTVTDLEPAELPAEVSSLVESAVPGIQIAAAERKERDGRVYYDVEGTRADGSEVELDVLNEAGQYKVVEIQRDIAWSDAPEAARVAAASTSTPFEPERVIESTQTDGAVIYELFAPGAPQRPALEIRVAAGKAEVLKEEWPH